MDIYTEEDLYADPDLSKNIHNDANIFYRQVMNLKTPIKAGEIDTDKLRKAISDIPETSPHHVFLSKLHRSPWKGIWPSAEQLLMSLSANSGLVLGIVINQEIVMIVQIKTRMNHIFDLNSLLIKKTKC